MTFTEHVLVVGIDGVSWNVFDPLMEAGMLPNLAAMRRGGAAGHLRSCCPAVTFPAWKCISTGLWPDRLGVYGWNEIDTERRHLRQATSISFMRANYGT